MRGICLTSLDPASPIADRTDDFGVLQEVIGRCLPKKSMSPSKARKKSAWVQSALERFERPLLQYAMGIVHDLDRARDIVQDTFLRLHKQDQSVIEGYLSQWLFTVCRNWV